MPDQEKFVYSIQCLIANILGIFAFGWGSWRLLLRTRQAQLIAAKRSPRSRFMASEKTIMSAATFWEYRLIGLLCGISAIFLLYILIENLIKHWGATA
jgi:hypothetical protein